MRHALLMTAALLAGSAQANESQLTGSQLAIDCAPFASRAEVATVIDAKCFVMLDAFVRGWSAGIAKGVRTTYTADEEVMGTTRGFADAWARGTKTIEAAHCGGRRISPHQLASSLIKTVHDKQKLMGVPYNEALTEAIEAIC